MSVLELFWGIVISVLDMRMRDAASPHSAVGYDKEARGEREGRAVVCVGVTLTQLCEELRVARGACACSV